MDTGVMVSAMRRFGWWRWAIVGVVVAVLSSLPAIIAALPAHPAALSLTELTDRMRASAKQPYQGFALSSGIAGLPTLPQLNDVVNLLDGETQLRVFYASPKRWRVDQLGVGNEKDLYQTLGGQEVWDFGLNQITDIIGDPPVRLPRGADLLPPDLARRLLGAAFPAPNPDGSTPPSEVQLSALPAKRVAGLSAAGIRITPTSPDASLAHIDIWAEPVSGLPVQVEITGRGQSVPVLVTRFLDLSLTAPAVKDVTAPTGAADTGFAVTNASDIISAFASLRLGPLPTALAGSTRASDGSAASVGVGAYGNGFSQFLVIPVPRNTGSDAMDRATKAGGLPLTYPGGNGVVLSTPLLSLLVLSSRQARRTYILVGLVGPGLLERAASQLSTFTGGRP
jgi:hypothetical protein